MSDKRLYHRVAREITNMIESGAYPPGTRLPGERELAERFGVSRVVVREAEISLEAIGRINIKVGSGVYVRDPMASDGLVLPNVTAFELTQTRLLFESECAALAATTITEAELVELEKTIEVMGSAPVVSKEGEQADKDFHILIARASGNNANVYILQTLWRIRDEIDSVKKVYSAVCHNDPSFRVKEHMEVMIALRNRDPHAARKAMRGHFARLLGSLLDVSEEQAIADARRRSDENRQRYLQHDLTL